MFAHIARIAGVKKPAILLLENVTGLLTHDGGRTFAVILNTLAKLGYAVEWEVCNSKSFGVPQNRPRVYLVGHLGGEAQFAPVFPLRTTTTGRFRTLFRPPFKYKRPSTVYSASGIAPCLTARDAQNIIIGEHRRKLSPVECERLQGFPDGWTDAVSDRQRYQLSGNSVTVPVVEAIVSRLGNQQKSPRREVAPRASGRE